jgi:hypothetical protein
MTGLVHPQAEKPDPALQWLSLSRAPSARA